MRRLLYVFLGLMLLAAFIGIFAFINADKLIDRYIQGQAFDVRMDLLEGDNMSLITVGTSSPLPSDRAQSCNVIFVNGKFFVFDIGHGAASKIEQLRLPQTRISGIFITHWHSDHYLDMPHLLNRSWQLGRKSPVPVYGPPPIDTILENMNSFLAPDWETRLEHHGIDIMDPAMARGIAYPIEIESGNSKLVYNEDGITITAFKVEHEPVSPSYGYRIAYDGKVIVISGDTRISESLIENSKDADILVHEAMQKEFINRARAIQVENGEQRTAKILEDIVSYHSTPAEAAVVAEKANVKRLILSHLAPVPENPISRRFYTRGLDDIYKGPILLAEDGDLFTIE